MTEAAYQRKLVRKIKQRIPSCDIMYTDPRTRQGIPDLLILHMNGWAMLEVKMDESSPVQPNQAHYIQKYNGMAFAAFINPQNEEEVLDDLQRSLGLEGAACIS
jgi:hypothetical protein